MIARTTAWALLSCSFFSPHAVAQQVRPDAGTLLPPQRQIDVLPVPGAPGIRVVPPPPAASFDRSVTLTPAAFRIQGNTLFSEAELLQVVAADVGRQTDMVGLVQATERIKKYYADRGYILTEAYLPAQQFAATGGTVVIQVLEARVGKANVRLEAAGISQALASAIVNANLRAGDAISERSLDRPVLLLRDAFNLEAVATVEPGANVGEADITIVVRDAGPRFHALLGADNHGARTAGQYRAYADARLLNPAGHGDLLSGRIQFSDRSGSDLYRVGYSISVGGQGTRVAIDAAKTDYALGKQFAALGASGEAKIVSLSATQPLIRTRATNLFALLALDRKQLNDQTETPASSSDRRVNSVRAGVLGNFVDSVGASAFNSYSLTLTHGRLRLDPATIAVDQGPGGPHTAGSFDKLNVEYQRAMSFSVRSRFTATVQAQAASKNLTSAEKLSLGGPTGVRGYPVGEAVGDSGAMVNLEYQHQLGDVAKVPLALTAFYDWGRVKFNHSGAAAAGGSNTQSLSSIGVGVLAGNVGNYQLSAQLAWRTGHQVPASDPDKRPRVWLSFQKWL